MTDQKQDLTEIDHIADDLFAGAGGWDLAAEHLGIRARGVEIMPEARATRDANGLETIHNDVWTFDPDRKASGLIASPPCQTFSAAGKGSGRKALDDVLATIWSGAYRDLQALRDVGEKVGDDRTALVLTPLHFATVGGYRWLAWEQVPTVLPVWQACAEVLDAEGWSTWTGYLHAEQYGVPQTRKRAFLLASLDGPVKPPTPTHSRYYSRDPGKLDLGVEKWVSMAEALGWGLAERPSPTITGGSTETGGAEPIAKLARYTSRPDWVMGTTNVRNGEYQGRSVHEPAPTITAASRSFRWGVPPLLVETPGVKGGNMQQNRVTRDDLPEWVTHMGDVYNSNVDGSTGRDPESVRVTVAEAGVLQSFPVGYLWEGNKGKQYLQCGNAVPPGLALHALSSAARVQRAEVAA